MKLVNSNGECALFYWYLEDNFGCITENVWEYLVYLIFFTLLKLYF